MLLGTGCNRETLRQVLKNDLKYHAYHVRYHQQLLDGDPIKRMRFARWLILKSLVDDNFPARILFSDESTFTNKCRINRKL